jgi:thioredoxin-dependent peroxiredoxin
MEDTIRLYWTWRDPVKFGVPVSKGGQFKTKDLDGNEVVLTRGITAQRWTFVIGKDGKIAYKNSKVNAPKDSKEILEVVEKLEE